jgi:hypothetical protein
VPFIRSRRSRLRLASTVLAGWAVISVSLASACTIPVFRYALERWESDRFLVIVYHDGRLTAEQNSAIDELTQRSSLASGPLNIEVIRYDLTSPSPPKLPDVQPPSADRPLPWVEIRARLDQTRTVLRWQGSLADAIDQPGVFDSPARREIVRRILAGHSSVWLLIAPEEQTLRLSEQLQATLDEATRDLTLPKGIGLPGSELYASIPLEIRYSVLPISHTDPKEQQFLKWLAAFTSEWRADTAYVIPVFGRCRALDVIPYAEADAPLIQDVAEFICGACSCQVKQANPGFDLLASVNWDQRLFGESIPQRMGAEAQPRGARTSSDPPYSPEYLAIPAGNQPARTTEPTLATGKVERPSIEADRAFESESTASGAPIDITTLHHAPSTTKMLLLLVVLTVVSASILTGIILMRR